MDFDEMTDDEKKLMMDDFARKMFSGKKSNKMKKKIASMDTDEVTKWYEKLLTDSAKLDNQGYFKKSMLIYSAVESDLQKIFNVISDRIQKKYFGK